MPSKGGISGRIKQPEGLRHGCHRAVIYLRPGGNISAPLYCYFVELFRLVRSEMQPLGFDACGSFGRIPQIRHVLNCIQSILISCIQAWGRFLSSFIAKISCVFALNYVDGTYSLNVYLRTCSRPSIKTLVHQVFISIKKIVIKDRII